MYCWKSINVNDDFGISWLYIISFLISISAFSVMFIPLSIMHQTSTTSEIGILYLFFGLLFLPGIHSLMHVLPLMVMHKQTRVALRAKHGLFPAIHYHNKKYLTKRNFLFVMFAPTVFITLPGIVVSYIVADYYVYVLLFTSVHIGIAFQDFLYIYHLAKAPKKSFIDNGRTGIDILSELPSS